MGNFWDCRRFSGKIMETADGVKEIRLDFMYLKIIW